MISKSELKRRKKIKKPDLDLENFSKFKQMEEEAIAALQQIDGVTDAIARSMYRLGFRALEEMAEAHLDDVYAYLCWLTGDVLLADEAVVEIRPVISGG